MKSFILLFALIFSWLTSAIAQDGINVAEARSDWNKCKKIYFRIITGWRYPVGFNPLTGQAPTLISDRVHLLGTFDFLNSKKTEPLKQKRLELNVNEIAYNSRLQALSNIVHADKLNPLEAKPCLDNSVELLRNLSDYVDFASGITTAERKGTGLKKFDRNWTTTETYLKNVLSPTATK